MKAKKSAAKNAKPRGAAPAHVSLKIFSALPRLRGAIALFALVVAAYLLISGGGLFIEKGTLVSLSFSGSQPQNIVSFMFAHAGPWHIALNALYILLFAAILGLSLSAADVLFIFLFSGILSAVVFSAANPSVGLVGASGGAAGIMASAFVMERKKTVIGLAVVLVLLLAVPPLIGMAVQQKEREITLKSEQLGRQLQQAVKSGDTGAAIRIASQKESSERELETFVQSRDFSLQVRTDPFIHAYAAFFGILYILLFRRKKFRDAARSANFLSFLRAKRKRTGVD